MKKNKIKNAFLAELKRIPIVQVSCEKVGISRNSVYRWKREDEEFSKLMDEALAEGEELVNDMSESQLLSLIKEKNFAAISFWLRHRNSKFRERVEVTTKLEKQEKMNPEQEAITREALRIATQISQEIIKNNLTKSHHEQLPNTSGDLGTNV
jgi:hypothetical protein